MHTDDETEFLTTEEAEARAREIANRNLQISPSKISCIGYFEGFSDYALVEFYKEPEGWIEVFTSLPNEMRLKNEVVQDSKKLFENSFFALKAQRESSAIRQRRVACLYHP